MATDDELQTVRDMVEKFLETSMIPDPDGAAAFLAPDAVIYFTGKTRMSHPREMAAYNSRRYKWVKKKFATLDVAPADGHIVAYGTGTLYGEWPDGTPFDGNRYIDRFEIRDGKITRIDVLNDSAERILKRQAGEPEI
ncbi:nuclear transport factor 2 family protein [Nisaea acidiphila]|uniref:Nuclear transport factor 2 family protein n=1 Tax=Nisaea acidiphila TaxID=1862145 RepID=A0A9J7APV0_9PROT|nr:nuclear transport factor 2 family protein [Nisaea acidiphila]UUX49247.1 nuclear transport factor 2 family protein [Nisaea acidiphila]